jgi:endonuclease/exonuclease/phosphatase family metal-dependent hydrolase
MRPSYCGAMILRLLTLNLWNISEPLEPRYRTLAAGLKRLRPDIVCLQEVYRDPKSGRSQAALVAEMCGHKHHVEKGGLAILASRPAADFNYAKLPQFPGDPLRHVIMAEFKINGRPVLVINTHLAYPPPMIRERHKQVKKLLAVLRRHSSKKRGIAKILCGDFNDIANSPAVRAILDSDQNFFDVFAACHPRSAGFTYTPRNPYVAKSWTIDERIDYVFATPNLAPQECIVVFDGKNKSGFASDHFGVFCSLRFRRLAPKPALS